MDEVYYSVECSMLDGSGEKSIDGTLDFNYTSFDFITKNNNIKTSIDWEKAHFLEKEVKIKVLFLSTKCPALEVIGGAKDYTFIFDDEEIRAEVEDVMSELSAIESENKRKKKIQDEVARKRREEQAKKAEEERQRLEAEKKKKEEEEAERKRIAEEESRRKAEEERRRKEEEERKRNEALRKKIEDREKRITSEIENAKNNVKEISIASHTDLSLRKALAYFYDNPYRVLGISVISTVEDANSSLDKLKKLIRLNAASSFKTEYHLNGTEKPDRELSILQNAITLLKDKKYKWFWFADSVACIAWQSETYRKELDSDGLEYGSYDLFLACYFYSLFFDPYFKKSELWKPVFSYYEFLCNEPSHEMIKSRFSESELEGARVLDLVRNFKTEIFKPIELLCESDDITSYIRLYKILKGLDGTNIAEVKKTVLSNLSKWFTAKEATVCTVVDASDEDNIITRAEATEISRIGNEYISSVDGVLVSVLNEVKNETIRYDMIKESYRHATWQLMFAMNKYGDKEKAIYYANKCYPYCKDDDKRKIRGTFGFSAIKGSDKDATNAEWDILGDNYYEGKDGYERDYHQAFIWYKKAAEAGNKYSMNSLGICYREGNGTFQSDYEASKWFEKAYNAGNPDGAFNLANCYILGKGKITDKHKGIELLIEAAKMGHPTAADTAQKVLDLMKIESKMHRLTQHEHYDLGYQIPIGETIIVEVELNYSANVYLMEEDDYDNYIGGDDFSYYGGRATSSPYRIKIPHTGEWHLVIDNGEDDMTGIITSVHTRTIPDF